MYDFDNETEIKRFIRQTTHRLRAELMQETDIILSREELWPIAVRVSYLVPGFNVTAEDEANPYIGRKE